MQKNPKTEQDEGYQNGDLHGHNVRDTYPKLGHFSAPEISLEAVIKI